MLLIPKVSILSEQTHICINVYKYVCQRLRNSFLSVFQYAMEEGGWSFICQHEEHECEANMIHACAKDFFKDINLEMNFVNCLLSAPSPADSGPMVKILFS